MANANNNNAYASASLYVGDLNADVTEALLFEIFNAVGPVASVRVCRDAATRRSLGYAYVNFHRVDDAERALDTLNFKNIRSRPCRIMWSHRDPSLRKSGVGNIFVKNLATSIDNKQLYDTFSIFGNILSCKVATSSRGESLGYGFVHYESDEAALQAINSVDGKNIAEQTVSVAPFKSKKDRGGVVESIFSNIYVKNLPAEITDADFKKMFEKFGAITSSSVSVDTDGKSRGFGFLNFETPEAAASAVAEMNGLDMSGNELYVGRAQKKSEREKELREKFEKLRVERQKKYAGVNLYIKNLGDEIDEDRIRQEFSKFGSITSTHVQKDSAEKSKGFGFVCFATPEEATKAVTEMNGHMLEGKPLYVALAQRKDQRRAQLEAQYAARTKMGHPQPQLYPPQGGPMFYQGVPQQRTMMYPPHMMRRQWAPNQPAPNMMHMRPHMNYQLIPMNQRGGPAQNRQPRNPRNKQPHPQQQPPMPQQQQPPMPQQPGQQPVMVPQIPAQPAEVNVKALLAAPEEQKKQMIGEHLFPKIKELQPQLAGKITGMLLEMDNGELLHLLESPAALQDKISEALHVLRQHEVDE